MISIGTDCSGIESPIECLKQLKISFKHMFSCEKDTYAKKMILYNYHPELFFDDMTIRDHSKLPKVDIYVCGFSCQPFSNLGLKKGSKDIRSNLMTECANTIKSLFPPIFILENVKNFMNIEKGENYKWLIETLTSIKKGNTEYSVYIDVLNTKNYGIPQNRERMFIIGIRNDCKIKEYVTPKHKKCKQLDTFLTDLSVHNVNPNKNVLRVINRIKPEHINKNCIVCSAGFGNYMVDMISTITTGTYYYSTKYKRYLSSQELLNLQGFKYLNSCVSNTRLRKMAGNTISVCVLKEIIREILKCVQLKNEK